MVIVKYVILITLLSFSVGCLNSCKPDEEPIWTRYEYLPQEAKNYIYFKPGTWWVYEKVPGGQLDTIEVFSSSVDTSYEEYEGNELYFETIRWSAKSRLDGYTYRLYDATPPPPVITTTPDKVLSHQYSLSRSKPGSPLGPSLLYHYPYSGKDALKIYRETVEDTIRGKIYADVKKFFLLKDHTFIYDTTIPISTGGRVNTYWAPNYGIIKREHLDHDITWQLVESNIIQ